MRSLFISHHEVRGGVTAFGILFLLASAMSLSGSMQIIYERAFGLEHVGWHGRGRAAAWLLVVVLYLGVFASLKANITEGGSNILRAALAVALSFAFWLATPRILLGPRIAWRRLVPVALATSASIVALALATPLYMPDLVGSSADRFGTIGAAFALLSWLTVLAFIVVGCAVVASQLDHS